MNGSVVLLLGSQVTPVPNGPRRPWYAAPDRPPDHAKTACHQGHSRWSQIMVPALTGPVRYPPEVAVKKPPCCRDPSLRARTLCQTGNAFAARLRPGNLQTQHRLSMPLPMKAFPQMSALGDS